MAEPTAGDLVDFLQANPGWQEIGGGYRAKYEGSFDLDELQDVAWPKGADEEAGRRG